MDISFNMTVACSNQNNKKSEKSGFSQSADILKTFVYYIASENNEIFKHNQKIATSGMIFIKFERDKGSFEISF